MSQGSEWDEGTECPTTLKSRLQCVVESAWKGGEGCSSKLQETEAFTPTGCPNFVSLTRDVGEWSDCEPTTEASCRISHIFHVNVDSDPEVDSRPALRSRQNFSAVVLSNGDHDWQICFLVYCPRLFVPQCT